MGLSPSEQIGLAQVYLHCRERFKQLEKELKHLHDRVVTEIFQDQPGKFELPQCGKTLIYEEVQSSRLDTSKLKTTMPSLYAQLSISYTYRRLSIIEGCTNEQDAE